MHTLMLSLLLLTQTPYEDEPPPRMPFPAERDVPESATKKIARVVGIIAVVGGGGVALVGAVLSAPAMVVAATTARLISVGDAVPSFPGVQETRPWLVMAATIAGAVLAVGGILLLAGGVVATVGLGITIYSMLIH